MTIQEAKNNYEAKYNVRNEAAAAYDTKFQEVKQSFITVMDNMYGVDVKQNLELSMSTWSEEMIVRFYMGEIYLYIEFEGDRVNLRLPTLRSNKDQDNIIALSSLLTDYTQDKGMFSVMKREKSELTQVYKELKTAKSELNTAANTYEKMKRDQKKEIFFDIVKGGDIVKRNDSSYWKITKITEKCVYAIHNDYGTFKSRRYKKDEFFNETRSYVDFTEVEG